MSPKAPAGTQSVVRAVRLLKQLATRPGATELAELTAIGGLARTTTYRLLTALESEGLVQRDAAGGFQLGPGLVPLGERARSTSGLLGTARPHLEQLAVATGETATLEILADGRMLIIDEIVGRHLTGAGPSVGTTWPVHATSSGKALLAALSKPRRAELLRGRLRRYAAATITRKTSLEQELEAVRRRGFAYADEELEDGFAAVSAAVCNAFGEPVAALSVNAPSGRLRGIAAERAGRRVRSAAQAISATLGAANC